MRPARPGRAPVLVIGVGNAFRGDDAAGLAVAGRVRALVPPGVEVIEHQGDPVALMETWGHRHRVYLADAVTTAGTPGTIHRFDPTTAPLGALLGRRGTHGAGVAEAIELARALDRLPARLICFGIEGANFAVGAELTPAVRYSVTVVCARLLAEVSQAVGVT